MINFYTLKCVSCQILVAGGLSAATIGALYHVYNKATFDDPNSEENRQYQFLYHLSTKIFPYLKNKNKEEVTDFKKIDKNSLLDGLKSEFSINDLELESSIKKHSHILDKDGYKFKKICSFQQKKEKGSDGTVKIPAFRLCSIDGDGSTLADVKGDLNNGDSDNPGYQGFNEGNLTNYKLGTYFKHHYYSELTHTNFEAKFNSWYDEQIKDDDKVKTSKITTFLKVQ